MSPDAPRRTCRCGQCKDDLTRAVERACREPRSHTAYINVTSIDALTKPDIRLERMVWVECSNGHVTGFTCDKSDRPSDA